MTIEEEDILGRKVLVKEEPKRKQKKCILMVRKQ